MSEFSGKARTNGKTLGFVPTMGSLHEGHLSLVKESKRKCDLTVVSYSLTPPSFGRNGILIPTPGISNANLGLLKPFDIDAGIFNLMPKKCILRVIAPTSVLKAGL